MFLVVFRNRKRGDMDAAAYDADADEMGRLAQAQPGYAEEWLEDDDAEVVAYLAPPETAAPEPQTATEKLVSFLNANPDVKALLGL